MITFLYSINLLVFIMNTGCVLCEAETEFLLTIPIICLEELGFSLSVFLYECSTPMHIIMLLVREGQAGKDREP
jgi:hypothetical protein